MLKFVFHIFKDSDGWGICMILKIFFDTNAFTVLFTKQGDLLPVAWTVFRDHLGCQLPFTAYGHFSISPELYQANLGSHEAVSSVNTALSLFRSWYIAHKCCSVIGQKSAAVDLYTLWVPTGSCRCQVHPSATWSTGSIGHKHGITHVCTLRVGSSV